MIEALNHLGSLITGSQTTLSRRLFKIAGLLINNLAGVNKYLKRKLKDLKAVSRPGIEISLVILLRTTRR